VVVVKLGRCGVYEMSARMYVWVDSRYTPTVSLLNSAIKILLLKESLYLSHAIHI
jgi:hypothetical protein